MLKQIYIHRHIDGSVQDCSISIANALDIIRIHYTVVDRYLRLMGDKTIPDEAPLSLQSIHSS